VRSGQLPAVKLRGRWIVAPGDLDQFFRGLRAHLTG
jgi:hypothetical protein